VKFSHFFIRRPIFAAVLSIMIVLLGGIALWELPVASYPEVVPPTIFVMATYPGASADTVAATVATPLEQEINGVENMLYMFSACSSDGSLRIQVTFKTGTDMDQAQVQVQNRVAVATPRLPEEVRRLGIQTRKRSPSITMIVHLISPNGKYDDLYLSNYAYLQVKDVLARLPGVGDATIIGARDYSMRIWINPDEASARDLTAGDIVAAIREQNVQVAAGTFGQQPQPPGNNFQLVARTQGRLSTPEEFGDIILKTGANGQVTRLRDVARVQLGARDYSVDSFLDGRPAAAILVSQLPGSNAIETADAVRAAMLQLSRQFPAGLAYRIVFDTTQFIRESIHEVIKTLLIAMGLVTFVVILFLQTWRASLIPLLAVPVSLIGTFAAMSVFGFSLNNLSLFALVLAIGIVVDDAIVVVENVERHIAEGLSPVDATRKAMEEVSGAVVAIALVLSAVFIPTAFMSGLTGKFYQQFALTIAVSTLISAFNSLTLSPALSALLLQPHHAPKDWLGRLMHISIDWLFQGFNRLFDSSRRAYVGTLRHILRHCGIGLFLYAGLLVLTWLGFKSVPTGFIPAQDKGYLIAYVQLPDGASLQRTESVSARMRQIVLQTAGVNAVVELAGFSVVSFGSAGNAATMFIPLKPFDERMKHGLTANVIMQQLRARLAGIQDGFIGVFGSPPVDGLGSLGGFKLQIEDRTSLGYAALQQAAYGMMAAANQDPRLSGALTTFRANVPQVFLEVDRAKAKTMRVSLSDIWDTLQIYLGSLYVNDFNVFGRPYQVTAQADAPYRAQPGDLANLKARNAAGDMVPLGTIIKVRNINAPVSVNRYNMFTTAEITGATAPGVSSGDAIQIMEALAARFLPPGMTVEWTELSLLEILAGHSAVFVFPLCVLMVFLVLAAQYESWSLPLAIILIVPLCLLSAIGGIWMRHLDNNLFTQIGFVVLIGLACKNAILIVEFARQLQEAGQSRLEAALEACRLRLRPILMTSLAFIFGVIPLMIAQGAGAEMRVAIGTAVFFGMLGVTFFGIFLTPIFYLVIRTVLERRGRPEAGISRGVQTGGTAAALSLVCLGAVVSLNGCAVGPNFHPPITPVDATFANGGQTNLASGPVAGPWWQGFNDSVLNRLIERALATNQDLRIAAARVREARALRTTAVLDLAPTVHADGGYTKGISSKDALQGLPRSQRDIELFDAGFDATWELDLFGRVRRSVQASAAEVKAAEAGRQDVWVSLIAEVVRNYFELRGTQNELAVARQNADNQKETLNITLDRLRAGRATELDVARARAQYHATLATIPTLETAIKRSGHRLSVLAGQPPAALDSEWGVPEPLPPLPSLVNIGDPEQLLRRRPDIRAAENSLAAAVARIGVATADLFPRVTFNGQLGLQAGTLSRLAQNGADTYSFGPRLTWAALDLGRVRARLKAAHARADAELAYYEKTVLNALEETENALVDFGRSQARRDDLMQSSVAAQEAVRLANQRFQSGVADFLAVLDAQRTQLAVQDQLAQSQTRAATSLVAVYKALGVGWEIESSVTASSSSSAPPGGIHR
jgi:multidrug efflux pump